MNTKYDWDWPRSYYARSQRNGRTTLKDVSTLFGIPYQTVRRKAATENWVGHVAIFRDKIEYFPNLEYQERFLELAKPLAHGNIENISEMDKFDTF
ncbi:hypothetical protein [Rummeliibacillus sp. POC4]|uniref:hypothetical protein n=1 Tax=Rummeliibacillus sp. POC4 TaxID=2305899 RepID=UPI000E663D0E|nr:hypothetical protein [Rummeliibacillus sp. POC4]RIJ64155.1 hypothetical protein D1606_11620 [Rummeliibacillus sp. POC4]